MNWGIDLNDVRRLCSRIERAHELSDAGFSVQGRTPRSDVDRARTALVIESYPAVLMVRAWLDAQDADWVQVLDEDQETETGGDVWVLLTDLDVPPWD